MKKGGYKRSLKLKDGGTRALRTKDHNSGFATLNEDHYCHAATRRLDDGTYRMQIGGKWGIDSLCVVLAAVDKDISSEGSIIEDADVGGLDCGHGYLYSAGKASLCRRVNVISVSPAATAGSKPGELLIDLDTKKRTAVFRQPGRLLGAEVTGLPSAVKLVVSMCWKDQFVTLL